MSLFTPMLGTIGGSLIGGSAGVLLLCNGDIMGLSGIMSNALLHPIKSLKDSKQHWRWVYIASFALTVHLYVNFLATDSALQDERSKDQDVPIPSLLAKFLGGLLVGFGTRVGNGCTTGHGICGIARFSKRSMVATATFTSVAMLTRFLISPLRTWASSTSLLRTTDAPVVWPLAGALAMTVTCLAALVRQTIVISKQETEIDSRKCLAAAVSGIMFAAGLTFSGMTMNSKVHDFLCISGLSNKTFDPTLMAVMGSGILVSWLSYQFVDGWSQIIKPKHCLEHPAALPAGTPFGVPTMTNIDSNLIAGTATFGVGWGLAAVCPGPGLYAAFAGVSDALVAWMPAFLLGSYAGQAYKTMKSNKKKKTA